MVDSSLQQFGGGWTQEKLARVSSYLTAYTNALKNMPFFTLMYIDAFVGTGYSVEDRGAYSQEAITWQNQQ